MRAWCDRADNFKGLPLGTSRPFKFLYAFKDAEPHLGLPAHSYKLVDWLFCFTDARDWEEGSRPISWPDLRRQAEFLGLSKRRTQALNRQLQEAGIIVMRDDPQGRRYGHRDDQGRITRAFGFDLSLLAERYAEFKNIAAQAQTERNRMKKLRQRKTIARTAIGQAAEELGAQGHDSDRLQELLQEAADLVKAGSQCHRSDELEVAVKSLERRRDEIQQMVRDLIKPVETSPMGAENDTHSTSTTLTPNDLNHTVIAAEEGSSVEAPPLPKDHGVPKPQHLFPERLQITPVTLVELAPLLAAYMPPRACDKGWREVVEAALYLCGELGINRSLWHRACQVMGEEYAAVAVAIVSTRPAEHFTSGPGGYFAGMLRKFEKNPQDLCLSRTLWRLKDEIWGETGHRERRDVERQRRREMRTKKSLRPGQDWPRGFSSRQPATASLGGFVPIGGVPLQQPTTRPVPSVPPRPTLSLSSTSKDWKPSQELLELEERFKAMSSKSTTGSPAPKTPPDGEKG
jgi:replication initiation protein RepC